MRSAMKVPIVPPIRMPRMISQKLTTCGVSNVVTTAISMPAMP